MGAPIVKSCLDGFPDFILWRKTIGTISADPVSGSGSGFNGLLIFLRKIGERFRRRERFPFA
jgi:hypothetical protein